MAEAETLMHISPTITTRRAVDSATCHAIFIGQLKRGAMTALEQLSDLTHSRWAKANRLTVALLRLAIGPAAVFWRVVAGTINAIDTCVRRSFAHIKQEAFEGLPTITDCDAPTAVIRVPGLAGVATTAPHAFPRFIGTGSGVTMCFVGERLALAAIAAARLSVTRLQAIARDCDRVATFAEALVKALSGVIDPYVLDDRQATVTSTLQQRGNGHWCPNISHG